jgi:hypothetical protein
MAKILNIFFSVASFKKLNSILLFLASKVHLLHVKLTTFLAKNTSLPQLTHIAVPQLTHISVPQLTHIQVA